MKVSAWFAVLTLALSLVPRAFAQDFDDTEKTSTSTSSRPQSNSGVRGKFALGLASESTLLHTAETGVTGLFSLNENLDLQAYFVMPSSDPSTYGLAAALKYTINGKRALGFHIGGGFGFGQFAEDRSFTRIAGLAGFHFVVAKRILMHIDGGLTIAEDEKSAPDGGDSSQLTFGGHSSLFGLSAMYVF